MTEPSDTADSTSPAGEPARLRLGRLARDLRRRDWVAIAIELAVVVVGILIAFQIDQWGDERDRARDERHFLERLYGEYRGGIAELDNVNRFHVKMRQEIRAVFEARDNPAQLDLYRRTNDFGCGAARFRSAPFNDTAFEELLSTGRLNIISDERLRAQIRDLATAQAAANRQVDLGRELVLNQLPELNPYYRFDLVAGGRATCRLEWQAMLNDPAAVNAIVRAYRVHGLTLDERQKVRMKTVALLDTLACELGKPECRH